jgi:uncharacterized membrane protein
MPKTMIAGRLLHPMLNKAPATLIPLGLALDLLHRATGDQRYADAAFYSLAGGLAGGIAAGLAGARDYDTIPEDTQAKSDATKHGMLNATALAATAANLAKRRATPHHAPESLALSIVGAVAVLGAVRLGRRMLGDPGMPVDVIKPPAGALPNEERFDHSVLDVDQYVATAADGQHPAHT